MHCPAEILQPIPAKPAMPANAQIIGSPAALHWVGDHFAREDALEARLLDARGQCPKD